MLAKRLGVSVPTMNNWMKGRYAPRDPAHLDALCYELDLSAFEADVLYYAINPDWIKFNTPLEVLEHYEVNRYREQFMPVIPSTHEAPVLHQIEESWKTVFNDTFEGNSNHWGLGHRDDGVCRVERSIANGCYTLTLHNRFHWNVNIGGDSHCFAPPDYCVSVEARRLSGNNDEEDGFGLIFEEISDSSHGLFRIRDAGPEISIFVTRNGGDHYNIYLDRVECAAIRPRQSNKLAILAIQDQHWFYVNNVLVFQGSIPRIPYTRLDLGIVSGGTETVVCEYKNFSVRVPAAAVEARELGDPRLDDA